MCRKPISPYGEPLFSPRPTEDAATGMICKAGWVLRIAIGSIKTCMVPSTDSMHAVSLFFAVMI